MNKLSLIISSLFLIILLSFKAKAAAFEVVNIKGSLTKQTNPQGQCGASTFGYIVTGTYTDERGNVQNISDCLGSISVPMGGILDSGLSSTLYKDSVKRLVSAAKKEQVLMTFTAEVIDGNVIFLGTLLSIEDVN